VEVLTHNYVASNDKIILRPNLLKDVQEEITPNSRVQELLAPVTTASDEVPVTGMVKPPQTFGHDRSL
jgi:hypothetical protein